MLISFIAIALTSFPVGERVFITRGRSFVSWAFFNLSVSPSNLNSFIRKPTEPKFIPKIGLLIFK